MAERLAKLTTGVAVIKVMLHDCEFNSNVVIQLVDYLQVTLVKFLIDCRICSLTVLSRAVFLT